MLRYPSLLFLAAPEIYWASCANLGKAQSKETGRVPPAEPIVGVTWKDKVTNTEVLTRTGQTHLHDMVEERRLRFAEHVIQMAPERPANHAMHWLPADGKRKLGWPRKTWRSKFQEDLCAKAVSLCKVKMIAADHIRWRKLLPIVRN